MAHDTSARRPNRWDYTRAAYAVYGNMYHGRRIIGHDVILQGGVLVTVNVHGEPLDEAIVVDRYGQHAAVYADYIRETMDRARNRDGAFDKSVVLETVFRTVRRRMQYSDEGVEQVTADALNLPTYDDALVAGREVDLALFMAAGVGLCRHQALAIAAILEELHVGGYVDGYASVDSNERWDDNRQKYLGHTWARYTNSQDEVYILDATLDYCGLLDEAPPDLQALYARPIDLDAQ